MATPAIPIPSPAIGNTATAGSARVAYNPTPPVKPVAKKSVSCLSLFGGILAVLATAALLGAALLH